MRTAPATACHAYINLAAFSDSTSRIMSTVFDHWMLVFAVPKDPIEKLFEELVEVGKSFVIVKHDPADAPDIPSEYEGVHYHGLTRATAKVWHYERAWTRVRDYFKFHGLYFKACGVYSLPAVCTYLRMPGKTVVINNLSGNTKAIWDAVTDEAIEVQVEKKKTKVHNAKEDRDVINKIREYIFKTGIFTETEMLAQFHDDAAFEHMYKMRSFTFSFDKAKKLAAQRIVDEPVHGLVSLCRQRTWDSKQYLSPEESYELVSRIMERNGIGIDTFTRDVLDLMDKKRPKVNTLWLHGSTNAGKSFVARSLARLAMLYHSVPPGSNRFMFQDCVSKRLIVIEEPFLDETQIEACKEVFQGTGSYVPVKNKADQYLKPTPVIITSNTLLWQFNSKAKGPLLSRCFKGYLNMKPCDFLAKITKELHPLWIDVAMDRHGLKDESPASAPASPDAFDDDLAPGPSADATTHDCID